MTVSHMKVEIATAWDTARHWAEKCRAIEAERDGLLELAAQKRDDERRALRDLADERDAHRVTLGFLEKLVDWGWGENAPDLAKQEWQDAMAWSGKARNLVSTHEPHTGESNAAQ